jgi:hypothetical protein
VRAVRDIINKFPKAAVVDILPQNSFQRIKKNVHIAAGSFPQTLFLMALVIQNPLYQ